jgi:hypothetical protein
MLNKIFISHWKTVLTLFTLGLIALAVFGILNWIPPVPRSVEKTISIEELQAQNSEKTPEKSPKN